MVVYATIAQLEAYNQLGYGSGNKDNYTIAEANEILETASREAEELVGTVFIPTQVTDFEYHNREESTDPGNYIKIDKVPFVSTSSITIQLADVESAAPNWTELTTADFLIDGNRRVKLINTNVSIVTGIRTVRIKDYTYGVLDKYWEVVRLTVILATLSIARSPKGKNALLNSAEFTTQSAGEVASPAVIFKQYVTDLETALDKQLEKIGVFHDTEDESV